MIKLLVSLSLIGSWLILSPNLFATATEFNFDDPKKVNSILISLDSEVEPIMGTASGITGTIKFDPDDPQSTTGKLIIAAKDIHTSNPRMTKVLHSEDWINVQEYPTVEFNIKEVTNVAKRGETRYELEAGGDFMLKGVTKKLKVELTLSHLPGKLTERQDGMEGDLLILRCNFSIYRKDFNIKPDMGITSVANKIDLKVGIVGIAPKN